MTHSWYTGRLIIVVLIFLLIAVISPAASGIQVALGDTVPLSGYSYGSPWAYLFLTGPNLPANGVPLNEVSKRADQGYFTKVDVDGNNHWSYNWNTANVGGKLDEGTYTVWIVNGPNDLSRLSQAEFGTISVTLGKPYLAVDTPSQPGSMDITSDPTGASVTLDGKYKGSTPLMIPDLSPGSYTLTFSRFGYAPFSTPVTVEAGKISEVKATLMPVPASAPVTSTPDLAQTSPVTTSPSPRSTQKSAGLLPALPMAGLLLVWMMHRQK